MMNKILITLLLFSSIFLISLPALAQDINNGLTHHMTPEEELRKDEIGRDFYPTDPPEGDVRMIAEFEHMQSVLIRYPFGIPMTLVREMADDCIVLTIVANAGEEQQVINMYQNAGVNLNHCDFMYAPTNTYYTRDYGPWYVVNGDHEVGICNFPYNRPRPDDNDIPIAVASYLGIELYGMPLIHTGGNWMCDGFWAGASTDLVWEENPALTHDSINALVEAYLGVENHHVLLDPLDEYIKHIDCWGKFLDVDKVLIGQVPEWDYRYSDFEYVANYFALRNSSYGIPYQVYRVYTPGDYPYTPYTNSLILNKKVLVPITGSPHDNAALESYEEAMPGYEVIGIMHSTWANTDALHCRAKGVADIGMLYVRHLPFLGSREFQLDWEITTEIIPYSGYGVIHDSLLLYYMVDSSAYQTAQLSHVEGFSYKTTIPFQEPGSEIAYFLHAANFSGRVMEHPYIGQPDPHVFDVAYATDAVADPDTLIFMTYDDLHDGKSFSIYNFTEGDLTITDIEEYGTPGAFFWEISPPPPATPFVMGYGDTLDLTVIVGLPVDNFTGFVTDTLNFTTENGSHKVIIKVNEDLLMSVETYPAVDILVIDGICPNPFRSSTSIHFSLEKSSSTNITVYDLSGKLIKHVTDAELPAGMHKITWHGNDDGGNDVTSGIYLLKMTVDKQSVVRKLIKH